MLTRAPERRANPAMRLKGRDLWTSRGDLKKALRSLRGNPGKSLQRAAYAGLQEPRPSSGKVPNDGMPPKKQSPRGSCRAQRALEPIHGSPKPTLFLETSP